MELRGHQLIGFSTSHAATATFAAIDPATGAELHGAFHEATAGEIDRALSLAAAAHPAFEQAGREARARLLEVIAANIEALGDGLLERAAAETGLAVQPRLVSERGRTCGQLRLFATVVRDGSFLDARIDRALPTRAPMPRPDLRSMRRALGPVVVFGASNFPLAFSVAGGDTASALAAGCPVVCKAHPNHPGTAELVGRAIVAAVRSCGLPEGVFSLLHGASHATGHALVVHPATRAVGFTGSFRGGRALFDAAARRAEPIPVFAEMGSTNPQFLLPLRLAQAGEALATGLIGSVTLGVGQFCTNPGLVFVPDGGAGEAFTRRVADGLRAVGEGTLLHAGIRAAYDARLDEIARLADVTMAVRGEASGGCGARPALIIVDAASFRRAATLAEEVFGPSTLIVRCRDVAEMVKLARDLPGQLTATIHATTDELTEAGALRQVLEQKVGRLLFGGFPTGVEVCHAMVHGGPYPATTDSRSTSVGSAAIDRFTRPVCWQSFPQEALPEELRDAGPPGLWRRIDGEWQRG